MFIVRIMRNNNVKRVDDFDPALRLLNGRLALAGAAPVHLVIALSPSDEELIAASQWAMTHDPSEGFRSALHELMKGLSRGHLVDRL